ncbi:MAG TPA: hypothetical protein VNR00_02320 [Opitutus sp.]|nr:hypothetical protein [Opitutus sp.]
MNVVPLNATTPAAVDRVADLAASPRLRAAPLTGAALRNAPAEVQRKEVAAQFEAILVRQLLKPTMTSMLGDEGAAGSIYGDLMTDSFATQLTRGGGLGLSRLLEQQLTPRQPTRPAADQPQE